MWMWDWEYRISQRDIERIEWERIDGFRPIWTIMIYKIIIIITWYFVDSTLSQVTTDYYLNKHDSFHLLVFLQSTMHSLFFWDQDRLFDIRIWYTWIVLTTLTN